MLQPLSVLHSFAGIVIYDVRSSGAGAGLPLSWVIRASLSDPSVWIFALRFSRRRRAARCAGDSVSTSAMAEFLSLLPSKLCETSKRKAGRMSRKSRSSTNIVMAELAALYHSQDHALLFHLVTDSTHTSVLERTVTVFSALS